VAYHAAIKRWDARSGPVFSQESCASNRQIECIVPLAAAYIEKNETMGRVEKSAKSCAAGGPGLEAFLELGDRVPRRTDLGCEHAQHPHRQRWF
jgi:hypothetical protein